MSENNLSRSELIAKLENIVDLRNKAAAIKIRMDNYEPEDNYERTVDVPVFPAECNNEYDKEVCKILVEDVDHTADDAIERMGKCYDAAYHPKKPADPQKPAYKGANTSDIEGKKSKMGCFSYIALGVCIFFALGSIVGVDESTADTRPTILIIAALGLIAFFALKFYIKKLDAQKVAKEVQAKAQYDKEIAEINANYNNMIKAYEGECEAYNVKRQGFLDEYAEWRKIYIKAVDEEDEISEKLEAERQAAVDKIESEEFMPALNEFMQANDIISDDYLTSMDSILDLLKSGRADDLKEAINLYEDIVYREKQLELEREKEEQRKYEEDLRRQDEERRYQEDKQFREEQERNRREEVARQERDAERRHQEELKQRDQQERDRRQAEEKRFAEERRRQEQAESERRRQLDSDAFERCRRCIHAGRCSLLGSARHNCTGFTPRH